MFSPYVNHFTKPSYKFIDSFIRLILWKFIPFFLNTWQRKYSNDVLFIFLRLGSNVNSWNFYYFMSIIYFWITLCTRYRRFYSVQNVEINLRKNVKSKIPKNGLRTRFLFFYFFSTIASPDLKPTFIHLITMKLDIYFLLIIIHSFFCWN